MKFEEILPLLHEGKKARCVWWDAGEYVFIRDNEFVYVMPSDGEEDYSNLFSLDIIKNSWEVIE